jgi:enoyl-CoA hydratase/carnithine racemase
MLGRQQHGAVVVLKIDRPQRRNALNSDFMHALDQALSEIAGDTSVDAIVLTAAPPGFCAGSDLKELATMDIAGMCRHENETARIVRAMGFLEKPIVAAVSGFALGGGVGLAVGCDLVVTHAECRWHMPEVPNGWLPPWALASLTARIGPVAARRLTWASDPIDGSEAHRLGLADYLTERDAVEREALAIATRLAELPRVAVASTKRFFAPLINGSAEASDMLANRIFAENCRDEAARATLRKFGMRVG